jgi:hypothetical protein
LTANRLAFEFLRLINNFWVEIIRNITYLCFKSVKLHTIQQNMKTKVFIAALVVAALSSMTYAQAQSAACCKEKAACCKVKEADKKACCAKAGETAKKADTAKKSTKAK